MYRCIELAKLGAGKVAPNPMVGAVIVHDNLIIGEGYHQQYGGPHAEVNAINNTISGNRADLLAKSTLYVSLEPCAHYGKTPPCTDLIIENKIPKVIIGCPDSSEKVNGKGIQKLKASGIEVETGILGEACKDLNKRFFTFHTKHRPYIILKWAETADGFIAHSNYSRVSISNHYTNRLVHRWRSEEASILVGTNTAMHDNPELTTRLVPGNSPMRLVIDMNLQLPDSHNVFNKKSKTIIFNGIKNEQKGNLAYHQLNKNEKIIPQLTEALYQLNILSVIVEGGGKLIQSFIEENLWDEARIITNQELKINHGIEAPSFIKNYLHRCETVVSDLVNYYKPVPGNASQKIINYK